MIILSVFYGDDDDYKNVTDYFLLFITSGKIVIPPFVDLNKIFGRKGSNLIVTMMIDKNIYNIETKVSNGYIINEDIYHSPLTLMPVYKMEQTKNKVALIYVYSEGERRRNNLTYFLNHHFVSDIKYKFVINGKSDFVFPDYLQKDVLFRENIGYDYGGYITGCNALDTEED